MSRRLVFAPDVDASTRERASNLISAWDLPIMRGEIQATYLAGGANNVNLMLASADGRWVLKLRDSETAKASNSALLAAIDGQMEAARLGVAPAILAHGPDGDFLSMFVNGETLRPPNIRDKRYGPGMVDSLLRLHRGYRPARKLDLFEDIRTFVNGAKEVEAALPGEFYTFLDIARQFETAFMEANPPQGFVHGDLVPQNFIACAERILLVDFDYCGTAFTAIDLACATSQAEMTDEETEAFLHCYDPKLDVGQHARVRGLQFINTLREVSWAVMAEARLSRETALFEDWSYRKHHDVNMGLARRLYAEMDVGRMSEQIRQVRPDALF